MKKGRNLEALGASLNRLALLAEESAEDVPNLVSQPILSDEHPPSLLLQTLSSTPVNLESTHTGAPPGYLDYVEGASYPPGSRIWMPLSVTKEHPRNPRYFYFDDDEDWKSLLRSLATHGQLEPAQAYECDENGKFPLKSGHRRRRMLLSLAKTHIALEIVAPSKSSLDDYVQARALNVEHKAQSHFDDAIRFKELLVEQISADAQSLALTLGISKSEMSKSLAIAELPSAIIESMAKNIKNFGLSSAYQVFCYWKQVEKNESLTLALVNRAIAHNLSVRALESMVKDSVAYLPNARKKREQALSRVELVGGELKAFDGRMSLELGDLSDETRNHIFSKIVEIFKETGLILDEGVPAT
ncbi:MAG: hypothetical protein Q7S87_08835 [Agitococcus sp.]|nr:hypothetical protein [Agitococcus sp.]MDO9177005.1 hypothetical protein [Agitococcus sp.]